MYMTSCMLVCIYMYTCIYIYVHFYIYIYIYAVTCKHILVSIFHVALVEFGVAHPIQEMHTDAYGCMQMLR